LSYNEIKDALIDQLSAVVTRYPSCASSFVEFNPKKIGDKSNNSITD